MHYHAPTFLLLHDDDDDEDDDGDDCASISGEIETTRNLENP